jgi:hypothetical protein
VRDLAESCVAYVERSTGIRLDYDANTLPVLDHWIKDARTTAGVRPDALRLVAHTAGAYFGELVRRKYPAWWRLANESPSEWRIEFEPVYLAFQPVQIVLDSLFRESLDGNHERYELEDTAEADVRARLSVLSPVSDDEFFSLTTRLDVLEITVEALRARRLSGGDEHDAVLSPSDYET